jgi:hypothetical protein
VTSTLFRKIPLWAKIVFPVAILLFLFFAIRKGGAGALRWLNPPLPKPPASGPPALTPKQAEEEREEIQEDLETEEKQGETEADELRKKIADKFGPRPE